ncbi:Protein transport protein sec24, partial [Dictyocoela roeselum]
WRCNLCYTVNAVKKPFQSDEQFGGNLFSGEMHANVKKLGTDIFNVAPSNPGYRVDAGKAGSFDPLRNMVANSKLYSYPMLRNLCVDMKATGNYILKKPTDPCYLFMVESTYNAVSRGVFGACFDGIMNSLSLMSPKSKVCFVFFNSAAYVLRKDLRFHICADFSAIPCFDENMIFFSQKEIQQKFEDLTNLVKGSFSSTHNLQNDFGGALLVSEAILNAGGIICTFIGSIVNCGIGELQSTEMDLKCKNEFYRRTSVSLPAKEISVNFFLFPQVNIEIPSLLVLSRYTGGENHYFPNFRPDDSLYLAYVHNQIAKFLSTRIETEGLCRIWTDKSAKVSCFYGNFMLKNQHLLTMAQLSDSHHISFELDVNKTYDTIDSNGSKENKTAICLQIAHLRTVNGCKRIKIINFCLPIRTMNLNEFYESLNLEALARIFALKAANELIKNNECIKYIHRRTVETVRSFGMEMHAKENRFPRFAEFIRRMNYLQKCVPLRPKSTPMDYKSYYLYLISTHSPALAELILHPRLHAIHEGFRTVPLSLQHLEIDGFYMLDTGVNILFFIARESTVDPTAYFSNGKTGRITVTNTDINDFLAVQTADRGIDPALFLVVDDNNKTSLGDIFFSYF